MGFEPTTLASTVRCSAIELQAPYDLHRSADDILPQAERTAKQRVDNLPKLQNRQHFISHYLSRLYEPQTGI